MTLNFDLVMANQEVKYKDFVVKKFEDNQWKTFGLPTDRLTVRVTLVKQYATTPSKEGA